VQNPQAQPALLVLNASQYIAQLTATVLARVHNGTLPKGKFCTTKGQKFLNSKEIA
jgi:hypothetical protein